MDIEKFSWDSEDQKKSFLAFEKYNRDHSGWHARTDILGAFLFQKMHEGIEWWRDLLVRESVRVDSEFVALHQKLDYLSARIDKLSETR